MNKVFQECPCHCGTVHLEPASVYICNKCNHYWGCRNVRLLSSDLGCYNKKEFCSNCGTKKEGLFGFNTQNIGKIIPTP